MFHGQWNADSDRGWESSSRNPRPPETLSLENIRFVEKHLEFQFGEERREPQPLGTKDEDVGEVGGDQAEKRKELAEKSAWLAHLCQSSGIVDELVALIKMGILSLDGSSSGASTHGVPMLTTDWKSQVDVTILNEMDALWGPTADPDGLYCVNNTLRSELEEYWIKVDAGESGNGNGGGGGWALAEEPDVLCFDFDELHEWRSAFEGKVEIHANHEEGIGRFGL